MINAKESKYVMLNVDENSTEKICKLLPGQIHRQLFLYQRIIKLQYMPCVKNQYFGKQWKLKSNGASSILVLPVEKILN